MQSLTASPTGELTRKTSILIIDDEPDILGIFKQSLERAGYSTYGFVNASAAFEHYMQNRQSYQIIISDVRMPGMTGLELARKVRKISKDVKIVLMSSFEITMPEFKKVLPSLKVDALLDKPIRLEKLNAVIETLAKEKVA
jgi:DNA-binding NtrC family response regulator